MKTILVKYVDPDAEIYARDLLGCKVGDLVVTGFDEKRIGKVTSVLEDTSKQTQTLVYSKCESTVTKKLDEYYKLIDECDELMDRYNMLMNKFDRAEVLHAIVAHFISDPRIPAGAYGDMQVLEDTCNKARKLAKELGFECESTSAK